MSGYVDNPAVQLAKATGAGRIVPTAQGDVEVKPLKFLQLIAALKHLAPILKLVQAMSEEGQEVLGLMQMIDTAPEPLLAITSMCTGKDQQFYESLEADEGLALVTAVYEVNKDFFDQKLKPLIATLREKLGAARLGTSASTA